MSEKTNNIKVEGAKEVKPKTYKLRRDFVIGGKQYARHDKFSHTDQKVVDYLLTNKIIE